MAQHEECETCDKHDALEERLRVIENIPTLMSFMNQAKGVGIIAAIVVAMVVGIMFGSISDFKIEVRAEQKDHETRLQSQQDKIDLQVNSIRQDVGAIKTSVAVIVDRLGGGK